MAIWGLSSATGAYATIQQPPQTVSQHKHGARHSQSIADIDAQGSSVVSAPNATGKVGSKVDITA
jgi:hypothetical protein